MKKHALDSKIDKKKRKQMILTSECSESLADNIIYYCWVKTQNNGNIKGNIFSQLILTCKHWITNNKATTFRFVAQNNFNWRKQNTSILESALQLSLSVTTFSVNFVQIFWHGISFHFQNNSKTSSTHHLLSKILFVCAFIRGKLMMSMSNAS